MQKIIKARSIGEAWLLGLDMIISKGIVVNYQYRNKSIKEIQNLSILIINHGKPDFILNQLGDKKIIDWMKNNFLESKPIETWGYSYGKRIFNYNGFNQMDMVIKKLMNCPETTSATISLQNPPNDDVHIPCINTIDFKIRENKLHMNLFIRSQDFVRKMYADFISLKEIYNKVLREIKGINSGRIYAFIASANINLKDLEYSVEISQKGKHLLQRRD